MMIVMAGRAVLITGAARGIGRAVAQAFAEHGDRIAVHFRQSAELADQVRRSLPGDGHLTVGAELADPDAVAVMVDRAATGLGGLDVLVNNAGVYLAHPILGTSYQDWQEQWRRTLDTNLVGAANVIWCAVPHLRASPAGRIINVSSRGAFRGEPGHPAYGASKAGLNALTQSLAVALAPDRIAVAAVAPGWVETDMTRDELATAAGDVIRAQSPFDRLGRPEEVAAAVVWLASAEAEWASGTIIDLNGASYLRT
jgi:3-oxoacyl-[acyl-carrier protein] reductase